MRALLSNAVLVGAILLTGMTPTRANAQARAQDVALRPQDRGVVRVYSQRGVGSVVDPGFATEQTRLTPNFGGSYGTGFVVSSDGLVVTAHHVVENAFFWLVIFPGSIEPHPALPVYVDPEHDIAILRIAGTQRDLVTVPARDRSLVAGESISVAGYPREFAQRTPAVTTGAVSRVTNDGKVEASMAVNEGDSGSPVCDRDGRLVGILIERGDPDQGLQGIAIFQPLRHIRNALASYARDTRAPRGAAGADATAELRRLQPLSQVLVNALGVDLDEDETDGTSRARVLRYLDAAEATIDQARSPEDACVLVAGAWDAIVRVLERHHAADVRNLADESLQRRIVALVGRAHALARDTVDSTPYFRWNLTFLRDLVWQDHRVVAMPLPPEAPQQPAR